MRLCVLVVIGANERSVDGQKRFYHRGWEGANRPTPGERCCGDLKERGLKVPAKLAIGDGAPGF